MKPLYCKTGDSILVKQRGRKTKWEVLEVGDGRSCKAKNSATGQVKPFQIKESHIVIPPDSEVPESLRQQLPRSIGVCRCIGSSSGEAYQLFSTKTLEVIAIQQQALSVIPVDFTIRNGEVRWDTPGLEEVESRRTFVGGRAISFPRSLAVEIEQQVGERF
jgi:hypothetical protein